MKTEYLYNATVTNVVDGDTVDVSIDLGFGIFTNLRIRLKGVDTPELNSKDAGIRELAKGAKQFVIDSVLGKQVLLKTYKADKHGRYLADVTVHGESEPINVKLVAEGLAVEYFGGAR